MTIEEMAKLSGDPAYTNDGGFGESKQYAEILQKEHDDYKLVQTAVLGNQIKRNAVFCSDF